ncbi:diaminopimelate epimerase [Corynebacterium uterequi]|uniref:Diaminopimelate epimerase n=1 Tax=Corynebacterium uterequi TaxID=1072256 RepID=A0A0G3HH89_9CORY|nr:diaminopimelate epimerase [Corynebacterium uterequi]AKK11293.1 diaminopimelate epimerase [Corynebacterium uterequi]
MTTLTFAKGHGTENDFIIIPDAEDTIDLTPDIVARLCDRRAGIGADGILHVVRRGQRWFMDYRNADGSVAEMCGNGVRVFAHWLRTREGVTEDRFVIDTRAGEREVEILEVSDTAAVVSVGMGAARITGTSTASMGDCSFSGEAVDVGNPHLAAVIPGLTPERLAELELCAPVFSTEVFPEGVNVEIVTPPADGAIAMRVWERGVGETRSCGTGTVAATMAALAAEGSSTGTLDVHVPGGTVTVRIDDSGARLTGPSRIVATGEVELESLQPSAD